MEMLSPQREAEIRRWSARRYLVAMPRSEALVWQAVVDLLAALDEIRLELRVLHLTPPPPDAVSSPTGGA